MVSQLWQRSRRLGEMTDKTYKQLMTPGTGNSHNTIMLDALSHMHAPPQLKSVANILPPYGSRAGTSCEIEKRSKAITPTAAKRNGFGGS
jgi:hypothetical protein